jgi:hypothetical protein
MHRGKPNSVSRVVPLVPSEQDTFKQIGYLIIDEKSVSGRKAGALIP